MRKLSIFDLVLAAVVSMFVVSTAVYYGAKAGAEEGVQETSKLDYETCAPQMDTLPAVRTVGDVFMRIFDRAHDLGWKVTKEPGGGYLIRAERHFRLAEDDSGYYHQNFIRVDWGQKSGMDLHQSYREQGWAAEMGQQIKAFGGISTISIVSHNEGKLKMAFVSIPTEGYHFTLSMSFTSYKDGRGREEAINDFERLLP